MKPSLLKAGILGLFITGVGIAAFTPASSLLMYVPASFEYDPPVPVHAWVTKLANPVTDR